MTLPESIQWDEETAPGFETDSRWDYPCRCIVDRASGAWHPCNIHAAAPHIVAAARVAMADADKLPAFVRDKVKRSEHFRRIAALLEAL